MSILSEAFTTLFKRPPPIVKPTGEVYALGRLPPVKFSVTAVACPACRFPVYSGELVCRRCGFRVR